MNNQDLVSSKEIGTRLEWRKRESDDDGCRWSLVLVGDHGEELWAVLSSPTPLEVRSPDEPAQPLTTLTSPRSALWRHMHDEHGLTLLESELDEIERLAKACSADEPAADDLTFLLFHVLDELSMYEDFTRNEVADHLRAELKRRGIERPTATKGVGR